MIEWINTGKDEITGRTKNGTVDFVWINTKELWSYPAASFDGVFAWRDTHKTLDEAKSKLEQDFKNWVNSLKDGQ